MPAVELSTHHVAMYKDTVANLAGVQRKSLAKEFSLKESKKGDIVYLDGIKPEDDATLAEMSANYDRADYEQEDVGNQTFDNWKKTKTPHHDVNKQRSACIPFTNDWGHVFRKQDSVAEATDPKSRTLQQGQTRIVRNQDFKIFDGLLAPTVQRGKDNSNPTNVAFPTEQKIIIDDGSSMTLDIADAILEKFEDNFYGGDRIICALDAQLKRDFKKSSRGNLDSKDFVDSSRYFQKGDLPEVNNISFFTHPMLKEFATLMGYEHVAVAWTESAITYNQFDPLDENLAPDPGQRFRWVAYREEVIGTVRTDDKLVVWILFNSTASASSSVV